MDPDQRVGVVETEQRGHVRAPVASGGGEAVVTQLTHECGEHRRHHARSHAASARDVGEAVARERRHHDVERVGGVVAERTRVGQTGDDVLVLVVRARPAVAQHEGERRRSDTGLVHEVQSELREPGRVDRRAELRERVELALARPPVEPVGPVLDELLQEAERCAVVPARVVDLVGPAGACDRRVQVVEVGVGHCDAERCDSHVLSPAAIAREP